MYCPKLSELKTSRSTERVFRGYNHNVHVGEGEFYEMENLSSDHYPLIAPRPPRGTFAAPALAQGMIAREKLCYIDGGDFIMDGERTAMGLTVDGTPKTMVSLGTYVIVLPDKKYVNTADPSDHGAIEASFTTTDLIRYHMCREDGKPYPEVTVSIVAPGNPEDLSYWLDTSTEPNVLKQYFEARDTWMTIPKTYVRIHSSGIGLPFSEGDGVTLSGILNEKLTELNGRVVIVARAKDYIVVPGMLEKAGEQTANCPITLERKMPDMDFLIESENRLWGCRYGDGANTVYACKRGDFRNWFCSAGNADDSFEQTVGSDGPFTGAVTHLGYPLFFKENCLHKVYGNAPDDYQIRTVLLRGVQKGCSRSLATVNEQLFYKSRTGVCMYDGSLPEDVSAALGDIAYDNAAGGALGNKYYVSMADTSGNYHMFVYDTVKKMWHREDGTQATEFCPLNGELYYLDYGTGQIRTVKGTGARETAPIRWSATTGLIGTDSPDKKYVSRLDVRMQLEVGARVAFYAQYDSGDEFEYLFTMTGKSLQSFSVPIRPRRCDHLRLRIVGTGGAKIFSITKTVEWGGSR